MFGSLKGYRRADFFADLGAGVTLGIVALPLAIGFAIASGVTPAQGLWPAIIAVAVPTIIVAICHPDAQTIGSKFGGIPAAFPALALPQINFQQIEQLMLPALTIAMPGAIESLLSAMIADGMTESRHDSNVELIGQGLANIVSPFFGGIPATGASALPRVVILRVRKVPAMDATGLHALELMMEKFQRRGTKLLLSGVQPQPMKVLYNSGFVDRIGLDNICANIDAALERARAILAHE